MYEAAVGGKIRGALSAGDIFVALQPIVDFERREVFGYEALARCKSSMFKEALDLISEALTTDTHFRQAGFRALLLDQ